VPIPDSEKPHNDVIDLITDACQKPQYIKQKDGTVLKENILDSESVWWKTNLINHDTFGRFAYILKSYESLAEQCSEFMSVERANVLSKQIQLDVQNYKYSVDAKSSETVRDKNNTQGSLVHVVTRNKIERHYQLKDDVKKSLWDSLRGRDMQKDNDSQ
jgi:hypothetical protein